MYTYRIVLDAYNTHGNVKSARVVTYAPGIDRADALRRIGCVYIARNGAVNNGFESWQGANNLPTGPYAVRHLPEWEIVSIRSVGKRGESKVLDEWWPNGAPTVASRFAGSTN